MREIIIRDEPGSIVTKNRGTHSWECLDEGLAKETAERKRDRTAKEKERMRKRAREREGKCMCEKMRGNIRIILVKSVCRLESSDDSRC